MILITRNQSPARRQLLKSLGISAAGAAMMPNRWSQPVVESVILPAHARTSVMAMLNGVVDGPAGSTFMVDASTSTFPDMSMPTFDFMASGGCTVQSQSGNTATIVRGVNSGICTVTVTVTAIVGTEVLIDTLSATANVIGGPPPPP